MRISQPTKYNCWAKGCKGFYRTWWIWPNCPPVSLVSIDERTPFIAPFSVPSNTVNKHIVTTPSRAQFYIFLLASPLVMLNNFPFVYWYFIRKNPQKSCLQIWHLFILHLDKINKIFSVSLFALFQFGKMQIFWQ